MTLDQLLHIKKNLQDSYTFFSVRLRYRDHYRLSDSDCVALREQADLLDARIELATTYLEKDKAFHVLSHAYAGVLT